MNGDNGLTSLTYYEGKLFKNHLLFDTAADVFTAKVSISNFCLIGDNKIKDIVSQIRMTLDDLAAEITCGNRLRLAEEKRVISEKDIQKLEEWINETKHYTVPTELIRYWKVIAETARLAVWRAERAVINLRMWEDNKFDKINSPIVPIEFADDDTRYLFENKKIDRRLIKYLNRLSKLVECWENKNDNSN